MNWENFSHSIDNLRLGDHLCHIYETEEEHRAVIAPFLYRGLTQKEKVFYITDERMADTIKSYLVSDGLDVELYLSSGQLTFFHRDDAYLRGGTFDPDAMIDLLKHETAKALEEGYAAFRVTGEMTWALRGLPGSGRLIEYEAKLNTFFPGSRALAICQYDRRRFDPDTIMSMLNIHPIVIVGTEVYENLYYITPGEFLSIRSKSAELDCRLKNLREHKKIIEALRESDTRYRSFIEVTGQIAWTANASGEVEDDVPYLMKYTGLSYDEIEGWGWLNAIHPDDRERTVEICKNSIAAKSLFEAEYRMRRYDGIYRHFLARGVPILKKDGSIKEWIAICIDITERKQAEQKLAKASLILNRSPVVAFTWRNEEGWPVEFVSENVERVFGYTSEEFTTGVVLYADCVHPDDLERVAQEVKTYSSEEGRTEFVHLPYRMIKKDGSIITISDWTFIVRDDSGKIIYYEGIVEDITERRRLEQEMEKLISELNASLARIKTLSGLIPICMYCKKIRTDGGYWQQLEAYISSHSDAIFSHSVCAECEEKLFRE